MKPKSLTSVDSGWTAKPVSGSSKFPTLNPEFTARDTRSVARSKATAYLVAATALVGLSLNHDWGLSNVDLTANTPPVASVTAPEKLAQQMSGKIKYVLTDHVVSEALVKNEAAKLKLVEYVQSVYRVSEQLSNKIVRTAIKVAHEMRVDPFLVLAVIATESSFNPNARSGYGAVGLMQVHPPSHSDLLEDLGVAVEKPEDTERVLKHNVKLNIAAGTAILKEYKDRYSDLHTALWAYNGKPTSLKYVDRVMAFRTEMIEYVKPTIAEPAVGNSEIEYR